MRNHSFMHDHALGDPFGGVRAGGRVFQDPVTAVVVGGAAALGGAALQSNAARKAGKDAAAATDRANQLQQEQFYQTREDNMPLMDLRNALLPRIQSMALQDVGVTPSQVMAEPGYQFGLSDGLKGVQNTAAARGGLYSGATLKALNRYNSDYATTKFNDAFNRQQTQFGNQFNRLTGAAGMGQAGVNQINAAGQTMAGNVGNNILSNANFQGAAGMSQANAWGNLLNRGSSYMPGGFGGTQAAAPISDRSIRGF